MSLNFDTVSSAKSLLKEIDFEFICWLEVWARTLTLIDRVNNSLQSKRQAADVAAKMIDGLAKSIENLRQSGNEERKLL